MNFHRFIIPTLISAGILAAATIGVTQASAHHAFAADGCFRATDYRPCAACIG